MYTFFLHIIDIVHIEFQLKKNKYTVVAAH